MQLIKKRQRNKAHDKHEFWDDYILTVLKLWQPHSLADYRKQSLNTYAYQCCFVLFLKFNTTLISMNNLNNNIW